MFSTSPTICNGFFPSRAASTSPISYSSFLPPGTRVPRGNSANLTVVTSSNHLHSHRTPQHPLSHPHAFLASTFPPTCHCMHLHTFTLVCVHPANLHQLCPVSCTCHVPTSWTTVDAAQPPPICPNELSPHSVHQTLILAIKHCCMLRHLLHPQDLFWECIPHGSLPPDSSRCIWTVPRVASICPQHCAELPMHFIICI